MDEFVDDPLGRLVFSAAKPSQGILVFFTVDCDSRARADF